MATIEFKEPTTIEALKDLLEGRLADRCSFEIKKDRLRIVENAAKGCSVSLRTKNDTPVCYIMGFMPSMALRAGLLVGVMLVFSLTISLILGEFNVLLGGALPFIIVYLAMDVPSRDLVAEVTAIISTQLAETAQPQPQSTRPWLIAGVAVALIVVVDTLAVINWPASTPVVTVPAPTPLETSRSIEEQPLPANVMPQLHSADEDLPNEYSLAATVGGRIDFLHPNLKPGEIIPGETVILRIDTGDSTAALRQAEEALSLRQTELASLEVQAAYSQDMLDMQRKQLALAEIEYEALRAHLGDQPGAEERLEIEAVRLAWRQKELEYLQRSLDVLANRRQLAASQISNIERELQKLNGGADGTEISLPVDVRIDTVNVEQDEFVHAGLVLFEATEAEQ